MPSRAYDFRPLSTADLPLVGRWLAAPHVVAWWGEPDEQFALISGDLAQACLEQYIVAVAGHPFGYLQCYDAAAWPQGGLGSQPLGTCGIDQFIGEPDMIARGHGSRFIRTFVDRRLVAGCPRVLTDPSPANVRAIRAYQKAGFAIDREVYTCDGRALLMFRDREPTSPA
jgi:aminoglycoside 6'-N-acetyltransferase